MNAYVGREEKEHLVRITALAIMLNGIIDVYSNIKSTDKKFITELKHAGTRMKNAVTLRESYLTEEAIDDMRRSVGKMQLMFLPSDKAKKEYAALQKMKSVLPMEMADFQDWYEAVIETTCKTCVRADYEACPARRVMAKYGVYPYNPEAKGCCQYSYADGLPVAAVEPVAAEPNEIPEADAVEETSVDEQDQPVEPEDTTQGQQLLPVILGLTSGNKLQLDLPDYMAVNLLNELNRPERKSRALCACHVGEELVAVDMEEVVSLAVTGLEDGTWSRPQPQPQPSSTRPAYADQQDDGERERYRVECKCGAEYYCSMNVGREKARCRDCKTLVFADRQAEPVIDSVTDTTVTLLTNRYWVEREERPEPARFNGKSKQGYSDPCNPFAS